jgi:hypothetical protein
VPLSSLPFPTGVGDEILDVPFASPLDTLAYLMQHEPAVVVGGFDDRQQRAHHLQAFWHAYRDSHPHHPVYEEHGSDLSRVIPLSYHGDEGRGKKRGNTIVISIEAVMGLYSNWHTKTGTRKCTDCRPSQAVKNHFATRADDGTTRSWMDDLIEVQCTNMKGHSFLQHWPVFILPGSMYKQHKELLHVCLDQLAKDLKRGFFEGIHVPNQGLFFFALVGGKWDLKWHARAAKLTRSFEHLGKKRKLEMCHECEGGSDQLPWEDIASDHPCWGDSVYRSRPWSEAPGLAIVPHDLNRPKRQFRRDVFHLTKVGIYRDFCACSILLLIELGYFGTNGALDVKLERAYNSFRLYTLTVGKTPGLRSFNKRFFNAPNRATFGWTNSKGSDTMLMMAWIKVLCIGCKNDLNNPSDLHVINLIYFSAEAACKFFDIMNGHGLFLTFPCGIALWKEVCSFIRGYASLAHTVYNSYNFCGFSMKPKIHLLRHQELGCFEILSKSTCKYMANPILWGCESNEDFIGRSCKLSRQCDTRLLCQRVIESIFLKGDLLYRRWKKNGPGRAGKPKTKKARLRTRP